MHTAEAYQNGAKLNYIYSLRLIKIFDRSIQWIATWNSQEKNKVGNTTWAKLRGLIGQKRQNSFQ